MLLTVNWGHTASHYLCFHAPPHFLKQWQKLSENLVIRLNVSASPCIVLLYVTWKWTCFGACCNACNKSGQELQIRSRMILWCLGLSLAVHLVMSWYTIHSTTSNFCWAIFSLLLSTVMEYNTKIFEHILVFVSWASLTCSCISPFSGLHSDLSGMKLAF